MLVHVMFGFFLGAYNDKWHFLNDFLAGIVN